MSRASSPSGAYAVVVHRMVHHADLPSRETLFGCELSIPGVPEEEYRVREEAVYIHRGHRGRPWQENKSRRESRRESKLLSCCYCCCF